MSLWSVLNQTPISYLFLCVYQIRGIYFLLYNLAVISGFIFGFIYTVRPHRICAVRPHRICAVRPHRMCAVTPDPIRYVLYDPVGFVLQDPIRFVLLNFEIMKRTLVSVCINMHQSPMLCTVNKNDSDLHA